MAENNENIVEGENEETLLTFDDATNVSENDILYLLQGVGSLRDKRLTLGALLAWIAEQLESGHSLDSLVFYADKGTFKNITFVNGDGVEISNAKNYSEEALTESLLVKLKTEYLQFSKTVNSVLRETVHTADGFEFRKGIGDNKTKATISIDLSTNKLQINVLKGLELNGAQVTPQRLNLGNEKSFFEISSDASINTLIENSGIAVEKGDIVTVHNFSLNTLTITLGTVPGTGTLTMQLDTNCSMSFICIYSNSLNYAWSPLGNVTVSIT